MVIMVIIRPDGSVTPRLDPHGEMTQWPTVREAREHFARFKLHEIGQEKIIGLPEREPK